MSDRIESLTQTILSCMTDVPNPEAGARIAAYRVTDELRKAMLAPDVLRDVTESVYDRHLADVGMTGPAYAFRTMTPRHKVRLTSDRHDVITAAWGAVLGEDEAHE